MLYHKKMKHLLTLTLITVCTLGCKNEAEIDKMRFMTEEIPDGTPIEFQHNLIPKDKIIHKGIFSADLEAYYFTISDKNFQKFDVFLIRKMESGWSEPREAFFNSEYSEHGMCFSPDGQSIYFSSTRPTHMDGLPETWHIWKSDKIAGKWTRPEFVDIPNLRNKLVSHPTVSNKGTMYFHVSNEDYTDMDIYYSKLVEGKFEEAKKAVIPLDSDLGKCTPFLSANEEYLIFALIGEQLDLAISFNDGKGNWINTKRLGDKINRYGQGNPYLTPDHRFLFFTAEDQQEKKWVVKWVNIASELKAYANTAIDSSKHQPGYQ